MDSSVYIRSLLQIQLQEINKNHSLGIKCCTKNVMFTELQAFIVGGDGTCYEYGIFNLQIKVSERYPFLPPLIRFETPIYHPNIDYDGHINLDLLQMPPKGSWRPNITIEDLLTSVQTLMAYPNSDHPLMPDIGLEYKLDKAIFDIKARIWTYKYARDNASSHVSEYKYNKALFDAEASLWLNKYVRENVSSDDDETY